VLPNTLVKVRGTAAAAKPLTPLVVVGRIVSVHPGRAWRAGDEREDADGSDREAVPFTDPTAVWKTVHATVAVEEVLGAEDPPVRTTQVTVAFTLEGFEGAGPARRQLVSDQLLVLPLFQWSGVDYEPDLWAVGPANLSLIAEVGADGALSLPCLPKRHAKRLTDDVTSLTDLRAAAQAPRRYVEIEPMFIA